MHKLMKFMILADMILILVFAGMLLADKETLKENVVRMHVVAASDSNEDQEIKLEVRDAVTRYLEGILSGVKDAQGAKNKITAHLSHIESVANKALKDGGSSDMAAVTLCREAFPAREYETFSLPSGVYESLRVTIGTGEGKNWWCVVFPSLCIPAVSEEVEYEAVSGGFSRNLANTITGERGYKLSFFILDCFGKLENLFHYK